MKTNKELIDKLKQGHIAIDNTGNPNVELLRAVLKEAFPDDSCGENSDGYFKFYQTFGLKSKFYTISDSKPNLPTIPLNDFLEKEFVLPEKWYVVYKNEKEYKLCVKWANEQRSGINTCPMDYNYKNRENLVMNSITQFLKIDYIENCKEITFEQFKEYVLKEKPMKEQFPKDDFGVIVENNNGKEIVDYLVSKGFIKKGYIEGLLQSGYVYGVKTNMIDWTLSKTYYSKTYTLQQLKNLENNMENKEIVDYQILPEFLHSVELLCGIKLSTTGIDNFRPDSQVYKVLSRNKVLDLWATPVYKSKEVVITVNNTVINIKSDRMVAEGREFNITWLKAIKELFSARSSSEVSWATEVESVKIGCKTGWNKKHLDEIITAYNELQKQK